MPEANKEQDSHLESVLGKDVPQVIQQARRGVINKHAAAITLSRVMDEAWEGVDGDMKNYDLIYGKDGELAKEAMRLMSEDENWVGADALEAQHWCAWQVPPNASDDEIIDRAERAARVLAGVLGRQVTS